MGRSFQMPGANRWPQGAAHPGDACRPGKGTRIAGLTTRGAGLRRCGIAVTLGRGFLIAAAVTEAGDPPTFSATVAPLLVDTCVPCHNAKKAEGGYRLDTFEHLMTAGDSGAAPLVAGQPPGGEVWRRINAEDADERMPPDAPPLSAAAIAAVRDWIAAGATFDGRKLSEPLASVMPPRSHAAPPVYAHPVPVTAVSFSPDGGRLLVGGYHEVLVFDVAEGRIVERLGNVGQRVTAIRFLADGKTIAVGGGEPGREGDVRLLDAETGRLQKVLARAGDVVCDVAVRPTGGAIAVGGADGVLRVIDPSSGAEVRAISSHGDWVTAVSWSDDGGRLATASRDRTVKVFDMASGDLVSTFSGHAAPVRGVALSADGRQCFSTGDDKRLLRWNADDGKPIGNPVGLAGEGLRVVRDGDRVFVPNGGRNVVAVQLATGASTTLAHVDWPLSVAVHAATGRLASGALDGEVRLFALGDGAFLRAWPARP